MQLFKTTYNSPVGMLQIVCTNNALCVLSFLEETNSGEHAEANAITEMVCQQLTEYFGGLRQLFQLPISQSGTPFQSKVWELLQRISYGRTISYMDLSKTYGDVKAIRAVAAANGKNSIAIVVPCHRVIGSNRTLTGYAGGLWRKQWLLAHEAKHHSGVQQLL